MPWKFLLQNSFKIITSGQGLLHLSQAGSVWWHPQGCVEGVVCSLRWMNPVLGQLVPWGCRDRGTWPSTSQVLKQACPTDLGFLYMRPQCPY